MAQSAGSWASINQELSRPENWRQIVEVSSFPLGEKTQIGEAGGQPIYEMAFGAYPSIDGSTVSVPMVMEFARQLLRLPEKEVKELLLPFHHQYDV